MPLKIHRDDQTSINLTPMIDIVFLLIIFFMVGTKFSELNETERDIAIQVPAVTDAQALTNAPRKRVINVHQDGRIVLDQKPVHGTASKRIGNRSLAIQEIGRGRSR
jgi:biopolymer transport protein ExbD